MSSRAVGRRSFLRAALIGSTTALAAGCGGVTRATGLGDYVRVAVSWSSTELAAFQRVLGERLDDCQLVPLGDDIDAALSVNLTGRPDVVALPQPKLVRGNVNRLAPLPGEVWKPGYDGFWSDQLPSADGRHYAVPFKVAHSSVVWYRKRLFAEHGLEPPSTWADWLELNERIVDRTGLAPLALGGADGWLLARFFENVLLRQFDEAYAALAAEVPGAWAGSDVRSAFRMVADMWGRPGTFAGGTDRALVAQFPEAVLQVFRYHLAAMVPAPSFVETVVRAFDVLDDDVGTFTFPAAAGLDRRLVASGDLLVLTDPAGPEAEGIIRHLVTPDAPVPWIRDIGGFIAANPDTELSHYSPILRGLAAELRTHELQFGLTDKVALGGALQEVLQDLLRALAEGVGPAEAADAAADAMARADRAAS